MIKLSTPKLDIITGKFMLTEMEQFRYLKDLNMILEVRIVWYENDNGTLGQKMKDIVDSMELSADSRKRLLEQWKDIPFSYNTTGKYKRISTLEPVDLGQTGQIPQIEDPLNPGEFINDPDVILEKDLLAMAPNAQNGNTTTAQDVRDLIIANMQRIQDDF